jgi:hypothetical protein
MNYQRIYDNLISYRQNNPATGYTENHHIVMKSMGGSDDPSNLVVLTGREHWIAHLLLYKIHKNNQTAHACRMMGFKSKTNSKRIDVKNSRIYSIIREHSYKTLSLSQKGENNSQYGTRWISNIELKKNKKISKEDEIPDGWVIGMNKWNSIGNYICVICNCNFLKEKRYGRTIYKTCSSECLRISQIKHLIQYN